MTVLAIILVILALIVLAVISIYNKLRPAAYGEVIGRISMSNASDMTQTEPGRTVKGYAAQGNRSLRM
jgi:hypothetical protein